MTYSETFLLFGAISNDWLTMQVMIHYHYILSGYIWSNERVRVQIVSLTL